MNTGNVDLKPIDIKELLEEFSDHSLAELVLEIQDLKKELKAEKKAHAVDEFARQKAERELELFRTRINTATGILQGDGEKENSKDNE